MLTQEDLVRVWSKGQPGLGLYLGCRAVRRVGVEGEGEGGGDQQANEELTVVTVDNVVDGMARVRTEEGMIMGAATDTLVLFKSAPKVQTAEPPNPNNRVKSACGQTRGRGQCHEDQREKKRRRRSR